MANNTSDQQMSSAFSELLHAAIPALQQSVTTRTAQLTAMLAPVSTVNATSIPGSNATVGAVSPTSGSNAGNGSSLAEELIRLTGETTLLRQVNELSQDVLNANTTALQQAAANQSQGSGIGVANTAKTIGSFLLGGLGIGSLVSEIAGLFGGGGQQAPAPLIKYSSPAALQYQGAVMNSGEIASYDYNAQGGIRPIGATGSSSSGQSTTQVVVQVNAMDSKSFMDHSDEIAQAVRAAMLNSSSLNDVISEM